MLTTENIEQAKRLTGEAQVAAFAAIARQLSDDLLYDLRENIPTFEHFYGVALWEHPGDLLVALSVQRDESGAPLGFVAEIRKSRVPFLLCKLGFAYLDPADTALVLRNVFGLDE